MEDLLKPYRELRAATLKFAEAMETMRKAMAEWLDLADDIYSELMTASLASADEKSEQVHKAFYDILQDMAIDLAEDVSTDDVAKAESVSNLLQAYAKNMGEEFDKAMDVVRRFDQVRRGIEKGQDDEWRWRD